MIFQKLKDILNDIYKEACRSNISIYIVGGFIRDLLVKDNTEKCGIIDIDFALKEKAVSFAESIADKFQVGYVLLNRDFDTVRVIIKNIESLQLQMDFTEFKGKTIEEDLSKRDFTVNAVAVELGKFLEIQVIRDLKKNLIYTSDTLKHFEEKQIVPVTCNSLINDPLRMVRAFSIGACLNFQIKKNTIELVKQNRSSIHNVSYERIRDEVFRLLSAANSYKYITEMAKTGLFDEIFPELEIGKDVEQGPYHKLDVYNHSLECIKQFEVSIDRVCKDNYIGTRLETIFNQCISGNRKKISLMKLALLYHDAGKPGAKKIDKNKIKFWGHEKISRDITGKMAKRFKLSNAEIKALKNMVYYHMRPGHLVEQEKSTKKARYRFFRDVGEDTPLIILISIADKYATAGELITDKSMKEHEEFLVELLKEYFYIQEKVEPENLIDGNDVMKILKIEPSPLVGEIIEKVKLLQMQNKIKSREQAISFIKDVKYN